MRQARRMVFGRDTHRPTDLHRLLSEGDAANAAVGEPLFDRAHRPEAGAGADVRATGGSMGGNADRSHLGVRFEPAVEPAGATAGIWRHAADGAESAAA